MSIVTLLSWQQS